MSRNFAVKAVHKQMYPATYNFRDEVDGTSGTDIEFVDGATLHDGACEIVSDWQGHRKVLRILDDVTPGQDLVITHNETPATAGTREFWIGTNNVTEYWGAGYYDGGAGYIVRFRITGSNLQYYDSLDVWQTIQAVSNDTLYHIRTTWRADNTFDVYVNGILQVDNQATNNNQVSGPSTLFITTEGDSIDYLYIDAYGDPDNDANYNIGDNVHWRHYKESTDSFEGDDVGTQGTAITWVDSVDTAASFEIRVESSAHKKILGCKYTSGAGGNDEATHNYASQSTIGWIEGWVKAINAASIHRIQIYEDAAIVFFIAIFDDKFQYYDGAFHDVGIAAIDNTWYHIFIQWYADNTMDIWVNNVLYIEGAAALNNMVSGINKIYLREYDAANFCYYDAFTSSLDGDERGDNRIFDYNDAYTREDITTDVQNVLYSNALHRWREATLLSNQDYEQSILFFQIYDINSKLAMEAEISNRVQKTQIRTYTLLDKNYDDLANLSSNTFSADALHDPTDSTCMLKTVLPNVSEIEGDLILVNADVKTDTYSTVTKNYPDGDFLRDISDLSDAAIIIEANGKCHLDDDLASGDSLDFDNAADHSKMLADPDVNDILDTINYFEVFGAINVDTGERFYKITDNSGDDRKRKWRITNNSFRTQTDVDAYAAKLVAKLIPVREITIAVQGLGTHNMGTLFTYKFVNAIYNVPSAAYYIINETMNFDTAAATILLSEGLIEESKYAAGFERPQNYSDTDMSEIYETDLVVVYPDMKPFNGATSGVGGSADYGIRANAVGEGVVTYIIIDDKVDTSRDIELIWAWTREDVNGDTIDGGRTIHARPIDGSQAGWTNKDTDLTISLAACGQNRAETYEYTLATANIVAGYEYKFILRISEAARDITLTSFTVRYHLKRSV